MTGWAHCQRQVAFLFALKISLLLTSGEQLYYRLVGVMSATKILLTTILPVIIL